MHRGKRSVQGGAAGVTNPGVGQGLRLRKLKGGDGNRPAPFTPSVRVRLSMGWVMSGALGRVWFVLEWSAREGPPRDSMPRGRTVRLLVTRRDLTLRSSHFSSVMPVQSRLNGHNGGRR